MKLENHQPTISLLTFIPFIIYKKNYLISVLKIHLFHHYSILKHGNGTNNYNNSYIFKHFFPVRTESFSLIQDYTSQTVFHVINMVRKISNWVKVSSTFNLFFVVHMRSCWTPHNDWITLARKTCMILLWIDPYIYIRRHFNQKCTQ